jgi:hypothetical protein
MKEIKLSNKRQLQAWLMTKPESWAQVVAVRNGLRLLPSLNDAFGKKPSKQVEVHSWVVTVFRANLIAWFSITRPTQDIQNFVYSAARAAARAIDVERAIDAARPLSGALASAHTLATRDDAREIAVDEVSASLAQCVYSDALWDCLGEDAKWLENSHNLPRDKAKALAHQPLWLNDRWPQLSSAWFDLQQRLRSYDGNWDHLCRWYDNRRRGQKQGFEVRSEKSEALDCRLACQTDDWWERGPEAVNYDIAFWVEEALKAEYSFNTPQVQFDRMGQFAQTPAAYRYALRAGKLVAIPQTGDALDPLLVDEILSEILEKTMLHRAHLAACGNKIAPSTMANAVQLLSVLGDWRENPKPGVLLMRLRTLEGEISGYDTPEGREMLYPGAITAMIDLQQSVTDLVSIYPIVQKMQAAALALKIQRADVVEINAKLLIIERIAEASSLIDLTAVEALKDGNTEIALNTQIIETSSDTNKIAEANEKRAEVTAHRVLSAGNFGKALLRAVQDAAIDGTKEGVKGIVSGGIKTGFAALTGLVGGTYLALGTWVASLRPIGKKAEEISKKADEEIVEV